ncbi:MAG: hypothetical protein WB660_14125 [Candidatus Sulfotelmatobacter sp.]
MNEELKIICSYVQAVLREWWVIVIEVVLVLTDVFERLLGTWLLPSSRTKLALGLTALVIAQYRAYRKLYRQSQVPVQKPTELEIHEERGSTLYVETPTGTARPTRNYFEFHLVVQNKGPETSVIRKFDLEVQGMRNRYQNLEPTRKNYIQTRTAQMMLQFNSTLAGTSLVVPDHNVWSGMIAFEIEALPINTPEVHCTLILTDANGSSAQHTFTLRVAG